MNNPLNLSDALPCPFCGSTRIVKGERYFAMCVDCGATGPERNADASTTKFTRDWNTRIAQPLVVKGIPAEQLVTGAAPAGNNGGLGAALPWPVGLDDAPSHVAVATESELRALYAKPPATPAQPSLGNAGME